MKSIYKLALLALFIPTLAFGFTHAKKPKHEKSKTVKKEFSVNSDAKLSVHNKYGNLNITTWDQNTIDIQVVITVKGDDLDDVKERLDDIDIEFESNAGMVEAKTIFENNRNSSWSWWRRNNRKNMSMKINYTIKMPKSNSVNLNNDYGNIYLDEIDGKASVNCDYGKIEIGKLNNDSNSINMDYCGSSNIDFMKNGSVNADYSKLTIEKAGKIDANIDYTTLKIEDAEAVDFNADYGGVTVNKANSIRGNSDYTNIRLGSIAKRITVDSDYGSVVVKKLEAGFESVNIETQYASVKINVDPSAAFNFEINTQYAGFKTDLDPIQFFKKITKTTKRYYEGKYGPGSNGGTIKIRSQYGGVSIEQY